MEDATLAALTEELTLANPENIREVGDRSHNRVHEDHVQQCPRSTRSRSSKSCNNDVDEELASEGGWAAQPSPSRSDDAQESGVSSQQLPIYQQISLASANVRPSI